MIIAWIQNDFFKERSDLERNDHRTKPQVGYSGINMTGGSDGAQCFEPKKIDGPYIVHPKKYKTGNFRPK